MTELNIIGGGLAGSEAAFQAAERGISVTLFEMRPRQLTGAHKTGYLAELVCSNSFRSSKIVSAPGLLKKELDMAGSLIMDGALRFQVPAGSALAIDRELFARYITEKLENHPKIEIVREEVKTVPPGITIISTGPLTSNYMAEQLARLTGREHLYFYDAIAPIIEAESIDYNKTFFASRYDKGGDDYINCPMDSEQYSAFYDALISADRINEKVFEKEKFFEGCMPVEVMAGRDKHTLRHGPLKPVGLITPKTGKIAYAVVQLRAENIEKSAYNMVGFQTRLKQPEQKRVFTMIPGLEKAEFLRYGSIHRNTFINSPLNLNPNHTLKSDSNIYIAGQITGVEGYIESTAMGLLAAIYASQRIKGLPETYPSENTAHGALVKHILESEPKNFQPSNINFGLFPPLPEKIKAKDLRREAIVKRALKEWEEYLEKAH